MNLLDLLDNMPPTNKSIEEIILETDAKSMAKHLEESGYILGGSRFFSRKYGIEITDETDFDFYIGWDEVDYKFLEKLGFSEEYDKQLGLKTIEKVFPNKSIEELDDVWKEYLGDDLLEKIFKHHTHNIQVLVRSDVDVYKKVFDNITKEFYVKYLWKSGEHKCPRMQIQEILNQMFRILL